MIDKFSKRVINMSREIVQIVGPATLIEECRPKTDPEQFSSLMHQQSEPFRHFPLDITIHCCLLKA